LKAHASVVVAPHGQKTAATMNPALAYVGTYHQFAVEAIVPLNSEGRQGVGVARRLCFSSESTIAGRQDRKRDASYGSVASFRCYPPDVRFALDSDHCADIPGRQLRGGADVFEPGPVGAILSHLTACDQSWMRARPPPSMNLLQRDQMDKIEPEH
jgi:hypothetical protein